MNYENFKNLTKKYLNCDKVKAFVWKNMVLAKVCWMNVFILPTFFEYIKQAASKWESNHSYLINFAKVFLVNLPDSKAGVI